jgi:putative PIN family toxin of toxin-antitoxin system
VRVNKYVLDANIWVSYIITQTQNKLLDQVAEGNLTFFICDELLMELNRVFMYPQLEKYKIDIPVAMRFIIDISVSYRLTYPIKKYIIDDPHDDYIVALALQTNSGFITSGDRHILSAKPQLEAKYKKLKILTKAEFERKVGLRIP